MPTSKHVKHESNSIFEFWNADTLFSDSKSKKSVGMVVLRPLYDAMAPNSRQFNGTSLVTNSLARVTPNLADQDLRIFRTL